MEFQIRYYHNENKSQVAIVSGTKTILLLDNIQSMSDLNQFLDEIRKQIDRVEKDGKNKLPPW